jgi:hypothetical protein
MLQLRYTARRKETEVHEIGQLILLKKISSPTDSARECSRSKFCTVLRANYCLFGVE